MLVNRAANDHEDKKQQRQNKNGRYGPSVYHQEPNTSNMDYMYRNQYSSQPYNGAEYPQWGPPHEYRPYHGPPMGHTQHHGQPRSIEGSQMYYPIPENRAPPPYVSLIRPKHKGIESLTLLKSTIPNHQFKKDLHNGATMCTLYSPL